MYATCAELVRPSAARILRPHTPRPITPKPTGGARRNLDMGRRLRGREALSAEKQLQRTGGGLQKIAAITAIGTPWIATGRGLQEQEAYAPRRISGVRARWWARLPVFRPMAAYSWSLSNGTDLPGPYQVGSFSAAAGKSSGGSSSGAWPEAGRCSGTHRPPPLRDP